MASPVEGPSVLLHAAYIGSVSACIHTVFVTLALVMKRGLFPGATRIDVNDRGESLAPPTRRLRARKGYQSRPRSRFARSSYEIS